MVADNFAFSEGNGRTGAADEIGGVLYPRVKVQHGADGSATDVSTASPLPAHLRDSDGTDVALSAKLGSLTEAAPANDTASSGINGRLQRIAQRITSLIALIPAALTGSGNFKVAVQEALPAGTNNIGDVDVLSSALPTGASSLAEQQSQATHLATIAGDTTAIETAVQIIDDWDESDRAKVNLIVGQAGIAAGAGGAGVTTQRTITATDSPDVTALELIDDAIKQDDAAFTPGTTKVMMAGFEADEGSTDSVDEGDAGAGRMTLDRKIIVTPQPHTAGGLSIFKSIDLDETEEEVKGSAGQVYSMWVTNTATATRWVKFFNAPASGVTIGTATPIITIGIPGNTSDDVTGLFGGGYGIAFDTAITVAATTGVADLDTGAPGANEVIVNIFYK